MSDHAPLTSIGVACFARPAPDPGNCKRTSGRVACRSGEQGSIIESPHTYVTSREQGEQVGPGDRVGT